VGLLLLEAKIFSGILISSSDNHHGAISLLFAFKGFFQLGNPESHPGAMKILFGSLLSILVQWIPSSRLETRIKESIVDASGSGKRSVTTKKNTNLFLLSTIAKRK